MKILVLCMLICGVVLTMNAQELQTIKLNTPSKKHGATVMEAFSNRHSSREYSNKKLSIQDLSELVWATIRNKAQCW